MKTVFYIAAFADASNRQWFSLGRERKLNQVLEMLRTLGFKILGLNIAPGYSFGFPVDTHCLCDSDSLLLRFSQLIVNSVFFFWIHRRQSQFPIIWQYNTRAAESIVAIVGLLMLPNPKLVLQLEDLPSARIENHGFAGKVDLLFTYLLTRRANYIFAVSQSVADALADQVKIPAVSVKVLPPSLDPSFISKVRTRTEPFKHDNISIIYAGSYQEDKGVTDLIDAFLGLKSKDFKLYLIGSAPVHLIETCSAYQNISFTGIMPKSELFDYYTKADVVVNPHRPILNSKYVFPYKLAEIIACGAFPLTTPVPGIEIFELPYDCLFQSVEELLLKLTNSKRLWEKNRDLLLECSLLSIKRFSFDQVRSSLQSALTS